LNTFFAISFVEEELESYFLLVVLWCY